MRVRYSATGYELTRDLEKYTAAKVARLNRKLPRKFRGSADCEVSFEQAHRKGNKFNTCTLSLRFDSTELKASETTLHMYAALDIASVHVEQQLKSYLKGRQNRGAWGRIKRSIRDQDWS
jgi:ribosomal subunit interface protein